MQIGKFSALMLGLLTISGTGFAAEKHVLDKGQRQMQRDRQMDHKGHIKWPHHSSSTSSSSSDSSEHRGPPGPRGPIGPTGPKGSTGPAGATGATGPAIALSAADFYLVTFVGQDTITINPGDAVPFNFDAFLLGSAITRVSPTQFHLDEGDYQIAFQVSADGPGQLCINIDGGDYGFTTVGRETSNSQIVGMNYIHVDPVGRTLSIRNPSDSGQPFTYTSTNGGGDHNIFAHLVITKIR